MNQNKGVSLVEVLVSILILAIIIGPFTRMFVQSTKVRDFTSKQLKVIYTVRNEMETLMSKNSVEAYDHNGMKKVDDFYIQTSIKPYSVKTGSNCFYIIVKDIGNARDEILIFTPNEYKSFVLNNDSKTFNIKIDIKDTYYILTLGHQTLVGNLDLPSKSDIYINLIEKQSNSNIIFYITGNTYITIYPGNDKNWTLYSDNGHTIIEKCFYRDYSIFSAKIEAFEDENLEHPIFKIQNIIRLKN